MELKYLSASNISGFIAYSQNSACMVCHTVVTLRYHQLFKIHINICHIYTQHSQCDHRSISSAPQLINQQSPSSWKSWWWRNCMLFGIWRLVTVLTKPAMELYHERINCGLHPTDLTFIILLLPVGIVSGFFTWDFLNKMHEFFICMVHTALSSSLHYLNRKSLANTGTDIRFTYRQQLEVTQQLLKLHVSLLESLMEQNYLCNVHCVSNNNLQLLIEAAAYEIGSYAVMSVCEIGDKLQVNSYMDRRVEKFIWNTALIHFFLFS